MKRRLVELIILLPIAALLVLALSTEGLPAHLGEYVISNGEAETGAVNLVTSIYLGYRAFDTFGETIVLLLAVSGVALLVKRKKE